VHILSTAKFSIIGPAPALRATLIGRRTGWVTAMRSMVVYMIGVEDTAKQIREILVLLVEGGFGP